MSTQADLRKVIEDYQWTWTDYRPGEDSDMDKEIKQRVDAILQAVNAYITATCEQMLDRLQKQSGRTWIDNLGIVVVPVSAIEAERRTLARLTGKEHTT